MFKLLRLSWEDAQRKTCLLNTNKINFDKNNESLWLLGYSSTPASGPAWMKPHSGWMESKKMWLLLPTSDPIQELQYPNGQGSGHPDFL